LSFNGPVSPEKSTALKGAYELGYQVDFLSHINTACSLEGKRVLEVGGTNLPRGLVMGEFGAKQWVGIEPFGTEDPRQRNQHYRSEQIFSVDDDPAKILAADYAIVDGDVKKLRLVDHFDVVVSIAAFEHVLRFGTMLDRVYDALCPGGHLESLYMPIWPCPNGHHLWGIKDKAGVEYNFGSYIIPPWGHLLMNPPQLRAYLLTKTDPDCADDIVHFTYHDPVINRLFIEDYAAYLDASRFTTKALVKLGQVEIPDWVQTRLTAAFPGRTQFDHSTLFMRAVK